MATQYDTAPKNVLRRIESEENAKKLMEAKKQEDEIEDRIEHIEFLASGGRDKKHTVTHNGKKFERWRIAILLKRLDKSTIT